MKNWCRVPINDIGEVQITNEMKAAVMGEFGIVVWKPSEDGMQMEPHNEMIPWTVCKDIYKAMVNVARTDLVQNDDI